MTCFHISKQYTHITMSTFLCFLLIFIPPYGIVPARLQIVFLEGHLDEVSGWDERFDRCSAALERHRWSSDDCPAPQVRVIADGRSAEIFGCVYNLSDIYNLFAVTSCKFVIIIIIIFFICKASYIWKNIRSEAHKIQWNTYIFKIFIISLNLHVKTKC